MIKPRFTWGLLTAALLVGAAVSCGDDDADAPGAGGNTGNGDGDGDSGAGDGDPTTGGNGGNGGNSGGDGDAGNEGGNGGTSGGDGDASTDSGPPPLDCPDLADREVVELDGEIDADTTWTCENLYILTDLTYVVGDSVLTIQAGTVVQGDEKAALVVTRGSQLVTEGTETDPVVMTSSLDVGDRAPGDWGGIVLLGEATLNSATGENQIEGIDPTEDRGAYGGTDDESSCGHLKYTRVEFAGDFFGVADNELNAVTLGACGSGTLLEYVQAHRGLDDGFEFFGGQVNAHHLVVSSTDDDGLDWDFGFTGNIQFAVVQQDPDIVPNSTDPNGTEGDNHPTDFGLTPIANPTLYNITLIGGQPAGYGSVLRRGTFGHIYNAIYMNFGAGAIDVKDQASSDGADNGDLVVSNSLFFNNGGVNHFPDESDPLADDDNSFDEEAFFTDADLENVFDEDPELGDAESVTAPDFVPAAGSPAATGAATPTGAFFDETAEYIGAFEPGGDDWTAGWTAYPED